MKVLLILADGMRPDSLTDIPQAQKMMQEGTYTMQAQTVMPSVTLPCHMSLFHSVDPGRHGTTTNTYMPQVRPIEGLCEVLAKHKKVNAFFYDWHELRDLVRPGNLHYECFQSPQSCGFAATAAASTDAAIEYIAENQPDFTFLYLGYPDGAGHEHGWMGPEYMEAIQCVWQQIDRIQNTLSEEYIVIVTADHGGHERTHGTAMPEDMTIPILFKGKGIAAGKEMDCPVNIKDLAPTIARMLKVEANPEWEGKNLIDNCSFYAYN